MTIMDSPGPYLRRTRLSGHWHSAPSWPDHVTREGFTRLARAAKPQAAAVLPPAISELVKAKVARRAWLNPARYQGLYSSLLSLLQSKQVSRRLCSSKLPPF